MLTWLKLLHPLVSRTKQAEVLQLSSWGAGGENQSEAGIIKLRFEYIFKFYLFNTDIKNDDGDVENNTEGSNNDEVDCADMVNLKSEKSGK